MRTKKDSEDMRILRKHEVVDRVGYSAMHISRLEKAGKFPRRVQLGPAAVGWVESEVDDWIAAKVAERDANIAEAEATS